MVDEWDFNGLANVWGKRVEVNGYIATPSLLFRFGFYKFPLPLKLAFGITRITR